VPVTFATCSLSSPCKTIPPAGWITATRFSIFVEPLLRLFRGHVVMLTRIFYLLNFPPWSYCTGFDFFLIFVLFFFMSVHIQECIHIRMKVHSVISFCILVLILKLAIRLLSQHVNKKQTEMNYTNDKRILHPFFSAVQSEMLTPSLTTLQRNK
jgi:hypothetical protein